MGVEKRREERTEAAGVSKLSYNSSTLSGRAQTI